MERTLWTNTSEISFTGWMGFRWPWQGRGGGGSDRRMEEAGGEWKLNGQRDCRRGQSYWGRVSWQTVGDLLLVKWDQIKGA